jgi:hypothetical protein
MLAFRNSALVSHTIGKGFFVVFGFGHWKNTFHQVVSRGVRRYRSGLQCRLRGAVRPYIGTGMGMARIQYSLGPPQSCRSHHFAVPMIDVVRREFGSHAALNRIAQRGVGRRPNYRLCQLRKKNCCCSVQKSPTMRFHKYKCHESPLSGRLTTIAITRALNWRWVTCVRG